MWILDDVFFIEGSTGDWLVKMNENSVYNIVTLALIMSKVSINPFIFIEVCHNFDLIKLLEWSDLKNLKIHLPNTQKPLV